MSGRRSLLLATLAALGVLAGPAVEAASAQAGRYFGRNKVQYQKFDFKIIRTEHYDIYYYEAEAEAAQMAARLAERWYARLSRVLNHEFRDRQPIILYADHSDFEQTNATPTQIDEPNGGSTEILKRRVVLPLAGSIAESDHVLGHELVHSFQFDMTGQGPGAVGLDVPGAIRLPLWFIEGMAEYLSLGPVDPFTTMWIRDAIGIGEFPTIPELNNPKYFPYRYGHALWSYLAGNFGEDRIGRILNLAGRTGNAIGAIEAVTEVPISELSDRWRNDLETYFASIREETREPDDFGRRLVFEDQSDGRMNLGPAISPDGKDVVYLSERDLFAIEMFVADAETGSVTRRITKTSVDPHFESLQWINSSGTWHPDGEQFLFSAVSKGRPVVSVLDMERGGIRREVKVDGLGEIFTPSWAPGGERVTFAAMTGGFTDLFTLDLETEALTQLTSDPYADLQPSWSPDGRYVAFVTDRYDADLERLTPGPYRLALYNLETDEIESLPNFEDAKHLNPQWSPDGSDLYFVSDHAGIANLYRIDMATREVFLITDLWTGVSGLTPLSPAISVASETGEVAFSVNKGGPFSFEIYVIDDPEVLEGEPAPEFLTQVDPAVIPPQTRVSLELVELLDNPRLGLADPVTFDNDDYSAGLSLDYISQPTLAFGASDYGVFFAGGASLFWSDLLGGRNLMTLLQINTAQGDFLKGTAAILAYENRSSRWNWAGIVGQIPLVYRQYQFGIVEGENGNPVQLLTETRFFEINREATGLISYAFNRANRVEFALSTRNIDYAADIQAIGQDLVTGEIVIDQDTDLPDCQTGDQFFVNCAPAGIWMGSASAALVYDTSIFGGTSPILGQRYRLEVEPTLGTLNFVTLLGDYRRYFRMAPFTLAGRLLHFGRYGGDSDDSRIGRLFLGQPSLVRGYDDNSFDVRECDSPGATTFGCPVFDQLLGSRIGVANVELRLPLLGGIGVIRAPGVPPIEIGGFFDIGKAWTSVEDNTFSDREWVKSAGALARMNLFGFMIVEVDYAFPFDRPGKDSVWQFSLTPGF
jgi:Tol biopolymer transport system component